ncbi:2-keto-4-pentenoate hydratase [Ruegeria lacuscaerulensis]|uniref:2-keto-4-pentenoate hydratase n=1 Tax=Ruegeria lacuscaerulensis TaxID=55218 RepID=UPI00147CEB06|nr:fumarylacetoacetate hydrolase family protein [Ruegeria lacuscaerulensis]
MNETAETVLTALNDHRQVGLFSTSSSELSIPDAYLVTAQLRSMFEARGDRITGRKIGFTNRDMWEEFGVRAPIWGYCTDRTTFELADKQTVSVSNFAEPKIEPEIIVGLGAAPHPSMNEEELIDCIDWISLGYEIVQSIFADWKFGAADTIAANALHGMLSIGNRHMVAPRKEAWLRELSSFKAELFCDGQLRQSGGGELVLGSPFCALHHLVRLLADDPHNPPLGAGEIVSTGTLTLAMPTLAGQTWKTMVQDIPLEDIELRFEA